jgi:hypothetical protein
LPALLHRTGSAPPSPPPSWPGRSDHR